MPLSVQMRHHTLCCAARLCYELRNESSEDEARSVFFHETGDGYLQRAMALCAEWDS